jgi:serine/threonine protein kinase
MLDDKKYNPEKSDVWAMGITFYAMLSGKLPFQHNKTSQLYKIISKGQYE